MRADEGMAGFAERFARFADETRGESPLYTNLSTAIAQDDEMASILAYAPPRQRRPNLFYAAVHDLVLAGAEGGLAAYYPSVGGERQPDSQAIETLRDFVAMFHEEIVERMASRATQTNEPGRAAAIRPALARLAAADSRPVALVELGASAGLLLHLDRYHYRYAGAEFGPRTSPVTMEPELAGPVPVHLHLSTISSRTGIDLDPLSPTDESDARWVRACVWPEDLERLARVDQALAVAREHNDVDLIAGDVVSALVPAVRSIDPDHLVCVLHSAALAYLDEDGRAAIERQLDELGQTRDLARICFEGPFVEPFASQERDRGDAVREDVRMLVGLTTWIRGQRHDELLARSHPHGAWLEWLAAS